MPRSSCSAASIAFALIVLGSLGVCARQTPAAFRDEIVRAPRGTLRDRAGRIVATDGVVRREYPYAHIGAHAIGYIATNPDDDVIGRAGIEAAWDHTLRGTHGVRRVPLDADGHALDGATTITQAIPGRDVTLTLDMALMQIVERAFEAHASGAVVVVDVHDGSVRALFSAPGFDPGELSDVLSDARLTELQETDALVDRTIARAHRPGGTLKPLTVLAGISAGIDPDAPAPCRGGYAFGAHRMLRCEAFHGDIDARYAIETSCSCYAYSIGAQVGLDVLGAVYRDFGLGSQSGLGLRGETPGVVSGPAGGDGDGSELLASMLTAAGQGDMEATPIQLAMAYAAIANGGTLWTPRIVSGVSSPDGAVIEELAGRADHQVSASPEHLAFLRDALDAAVNEPAGTAYEERSERVRVAGKTGHGYLSDWEPTATWFAGFAPSDDPEVAIVVLIDGSHRYEPARVAVEVLEQYLLR